jgi:hypothetical protein
VTLQSVWTEFSRQLTYIFFNAAPTAAPRQWGNSEQVTVELNAQSNNGFAWTSSVKTLPKYGKLEPDKATGGYKYTPNPEFVEPGISDTFTITIDNGASAKLPGLAGLVQGVLHSLAVAMGTAKPDTIDRQITVSLPGTKTGAGQYGGDVAKLAELHRKQETGWHYFGVQAQLPGNPCSK